MEEKDVPLKAFVTRYGSYKSPVMPIGLMNASTLLMDLIKHIFFPYLDILAFLKNKREN